MTHGRHPGRAHRARRVPVEVVGIGDRAGAKRAAEPIIAALSVQSAGGDELQPDAAAPRTSAVERARAAGALAATPPPSGQRLPLAGVERRARAFATSWETTAAWKLAARSARRASTSSSGEVADRVDERRLQAAEAEVEPGLAGSSRPGSVNALGVAALGLALDRRPARVAEAEQPRRLVERLAGGVVERLADHLVGRSGRVTAASSVWPPLAISARNGGSSGSGSRKAAATWPWRWSTAISGLPPRRRQRLRRVDPDEQRADQPRVGRHRDRVDVVELAAGLGERRVDDRVDQLEVVAGGDLGHDPAVARRGSPPARRRRC